jgi:hypothetical protein
VTPIRSVLVRSRLTTVLTRAAASAAIIAVTSVSLAAIPITSQVPVAGAAGPATTAYMPLADPVRLVDTRDSGALGAGGVAAVRVAGAAPLPPLATSRAAVLNVTVVGPAAVGFWSVYPAGQPRPNAANLNVDERWALLGDGLAVPNLVTVPIGVDGTVEVFTQSGGHVVVDLLGTYQTSDATSAGRFAPRPSPERILDTRTFLAVTPGQSAQVPVPGAAGASAAVVNLTVIANAPGFWTAYAAGAQRPNTANVNALYPLHVVGNQAIVPLDASGAFQVYSQSGGHLIVDLVGTITGPTAAVGTDGLFVPLATPTRFLDTREPTSPLGGQLPLPGWSFEVPVASNPAVGRSDVAALALNFTMTEALASGYATVSPAGTNPPGQRTRATSSLYLVRAAQTLPSHVTVGVSNRGVDVFSQSGGHLVLDVAGYYLGTPVAAVHAAATNTVGVPGGCLGWPTTPVAAVVTGSSRATVMRAQQRLLDLGYWLQAVDGTFGVTTSQAVMAFQKYTGLRASGSLDEDTAAALNRTLCRPTPTITNQGDLFEVDKRKQLGFIVRGGRALWVLNVSTGGGYDYEAIDKKTGERISDTAITPSGSFRVYRVHDEARYFGSLGELYRPRFVVGGVAVHGYRSVPNYPASHGCIRVTNPAMDMIWATNAMPMRSLVVIHG